MMEFFSQGMALLDSHSIGGELTFGTGYVSLLIDKPRLESLGGGKNLVACLGGFSVSTTLQLLKLDKASATTLMSSQMMRRKP